jgi:eukaryotic-like serine/threonine-protein kinase
MNRGRAIALTWALIVVGVSPSAAQAGYWPMFHLDPSHSGVSTETGISASGMASFGLLWHSPPIGAPSYSSPAVVYDKTLKRALVYLGSTNGAVDAYSTRTGRRVWRYMTGNQVTSSPAVYGGSVFIGSGDGYVYKLNGATGALDCRFATGGRTPSSPVVVDPDGTGPMGATVYVGDNGATGGPDGGHMWAFRASDCGQVWSFDGFGNPPGSQPLAGSWSPPAFAHDANGTPVIVFGSSDPDNAVYSLDARTGALVWRFATHAPQPDDDVGAGSTISAPGVNGFADGAAYVLGKDGYMYALNLTTGALRWEFNVNADSPGLTGDMISTASLDGANLYFGYQAGLYKLNAVTGAKIWKTQDLGVTTASIADSPAVVGPAGDKVVFVADIGGTIYAFSAGTGTKLWSYPTGRLIWSSPAISNGRMFIAGATRKLYAFGIVTPVALRPRSPGTHGH